MNPNNTGFQLVICDCWRNSYISHCCNGVAYLSLSHFYLLKIYNYKKIPMVCTNTQNDVVLQIIQKFVGLMLQVTKGL